MKNEMMAAMAVGVVLAAGPVRAGDELAVSEVKVESSGPQNWADLLRGRISWKEFKSREASRQVDWSNHPCLPGERRVDTGESGIACYPARSFNFSCVAEGYDVFEGEGGPVRVPRGLKCTPPQGAGGRSGAGDTHQAP